MAAVMEAKKDENVTIANSNTAMEYILSPTFRGWTSMLAGVNCVRLQCKEVM